jgi:hypothetical protein
VIFVQLSIPAGFVAQEIDPFFAFHGSDRGVSGII